MPKFLIAGLKVQMDVTYDLLKVRSEKYLNDFCGEPDIVITLYDGLLEQMQERVPGLDYANLEYIATSVYFYKALLKHEGFMLHSSCISYGGKAYFFTADSGTGKSTHTGLWNKYIDGVEFINDDKPAIRKIDGEYYACGTPWSGKTALNSDVFLPVGAVALLKRGNNEISKAPNNRAVTFILKQTSLPDRINMTDRLAELLDGFVRTTPIYDFACDMSEEAVKTSFEAMTGEKYVKRT